jgi:hypothetical protein
MSHLGPAQLEREDIVVFLPLVQNPILLAPM